LIDLKTTETTPLTNVPDFSKTTPLFQEPLSVISLKSIEGGYVAIFDLSNLSNCQLKEYCIFLILHLNIGVLFRVNRPLNFLGFHLSNFGKNQHLKTK